MPAQVIQATEQLLDALRKELHECGAMLALLDRQQAVASRSGDDVLRWVTAVNAQSAAVERSRHLREMRRSELARLLAQPEDATFVVLVPQLPQTFRPAIDAVVRENEQLIARIRTRVRQNHLLIARSLEVMQHVINAFVPAPQPIP